jgi:hypothetical protein
MPNFVTFDDGLSYVPISQIESFGHESEDQRKGTTWIKLTSGHVVYSQWPVSKVAELLGPNANLHY